MTAFGLNVERWPAGSTFYPEHDESRTGQEEVYVAIEGWATLTADGVEHRLEPGVFARVAPGVRRKILPGDEGVTLLCIGGVPSGVYSPPRFTEAGAPWADPG